MFTRFILVILLLTAPIASAATPFLLGQDYTEWAPPNATSMVTDKTGAIYILSPNLVTKLSPDGKTIVWQSQLAAFARAIAVDPNGGVYLGGANSVGDMAVSKLNQGGVGVAWTLDTGYSLGADSIPMLGADASGRVWATWRDVEGLTTFVHLNATGTAVDYVAPQTPHELSALTVDASGAVYTTFINVLGFSFTRLSSDGTETFNTQVSQSPPSAIALDGNGNAVIYVAGTVLRFNAAGTLTSSKVLMTNANATYSAFAVDAAGNAYTTGYSRSGYYPVKNTLATCGSYFLTVSAPDGSILQTTYIPGAVGQSLLAVRADGSVLLIGTASTSYTPTRLTPFANAGTTGQGKILQQLSPNANATVFPLSCSANGASFQVGALSAGELFTLFGDGLGPAVGVQANTQATLPKQLGDVQVTFDGTPAPLIWAQDSQINLVTPSSLQSGRTTQVCVTRGSLSLGCLSLQVQQTTPGIFTSDGTYAVALNQDGSVNSANNPAAKGSLVSVFATGVGPITPAQGDGAIIGLPLPSNALRMDLTEIVPKGSPIGATMLVPAQVAYAGPAPNRPAGISQINFRLGSSSSSGVSANTYVLTVGGVQSLPFTVYY